MVTTKHVPQVVTHYHLPDRRPFLNLSDLTDVEAYRVMNELLEMRARGLQNRSFGRVYLEWRRATEARMRELFVEAGGEPERHAPHYFVLGESRWYEGLACNMQAVTLPLEALPGRQASFTLVDSFSAMGLGPKFGIEHLPEAHEALVYGLGQLEDVVSLYGVPDDQPPQDGYAGYERKPVKQFIEVQLWCDEPVAHFLS